VLGKASIRGCPAKLRRGCGVLPEETARLPRVVQTLSLDGSRRLPVDWNTLG